MMRDIGDIKMLTKKEYLDEQNDVLNEEYESFLEILRRHGQTAVDFNTFVENKYASYIIEETEFGADSYLDSAYEDQFYADTDY